MTLVGKLSPNTIKNTLRGHYPSQHREGLLDRQLCKQAGKGKVSEIAIKTHLVSTHSTPSKTDTKNKEDVLRLAQSPVTQALRRLTLKDGKPKAGRDYKRNSRPSCAAA